jgi:AraC-like DNA-binding protein
MRSPGEGNSTAPIDLTGRCPVVQQASAEAVAQATCRLVSCVLWRIGAGWSIPRRRISDLFLFMPVRGDLVIGGPGGDEVLPVGSLAIVPPGVDHTVGFAGRIRSGRVLSLHAHLTTTWGEPWPFPHDRLVVGLRDHQAWINSCTRLAGLVADHPGLGAALGRSLLRSLLAEAVLAGHPVDAPPTGVDPRIAAIIAAIRADPGAAPPITALARSQGIGPLRLRQLFHASLGCSPKAFVDRLRLARAAELLHAGKPVAAVARACGYGTIRQLQVRFKAAYGCTPSAWAAEERANGI